MEICEHSENGFMLREGYAVDTYNGTLPNTLVYKGSPYECN